MSGRVERRSFPLSNLRVDRDSAFDGGSGISGYAAMFGSLSQPLSEYGSGQFRETIAKGAFRRTIAEDDARALIHHDDRFLIGRVSSGSLKLREDGTGLHFFIRLPETSYANDLRELLRRGDLTQMSFAFVVVRDTWATVNGEQVRTLNEVSLMEISPVVWPAYTDTAVGLASASRESVAERLDQLERHERVWDVLGLPGDARRITEPVLRAAPTPDTELHEADHAWVSFLRGVTVGTLTLHAGSNATMTLPVGIPDSAFLDILLAGAAGEVMRTGKAGPWCAFDAAKALEIAERLVGPERADDEINARSQRITRELKVGRRPIAALAGHLKRNGGQVSGKFVQTTFETCAL